MVQLMRRESAYENAARITEVDSALSYRNPDRKGPNLPTPGTIGASDSLALCSYSVVQYQRLKAAGVNSESTSKLRGYSSPNQPDWDLSCLIPT